MPTASWLLLACVGAGSEADAEPHEADRDGDGYVASEDCADDDPDRNPSRGETCNGVDDDCDELVDEDPLYGPTWYEDGDGDGWGYATRAACELPDGFVTLGGDCADRNPAVFPGADELCNGDDDDCDDLVDEAGAVDASTWHRDDDGDGFGVEEGARRRCQAPAGTVDDATDCDDTDADVSPAAPEVCGDGLDNDCDGLPGACLEGELTPDQAEAWLVGDELELAGFALAGVGDPDADGVPDWAVGLPHHELTVGEVWLLSGEGRGELTEADATATFTAASGEVGKFLGALPDFDDDGIDDLFVSGPTGDDDRGRVYLVPGADAFGAVALSDVEDLLVGPVGSMFGDEVVVGDGDGDGELDVLVGSPTDNALWYVRGPFGGTVGVSEVGVGIKGRGEEQFGTGAAFVDLDGDGLDELVSGAILSDELRGFTAPDEELDAEDAGWIWAAPEEGEPGKDLLVVDLDVDGHDDLLVGSPGVDEGRGTVYVLHGPIEAGDLEDTPTQILGTRAEDHVGFALSDAGDVDGDGVVDVLVGGPRVESGGPGNAWIVSGPLSGMHEVSDATAHFTGDADGDQLGCSVAGVGDVDGDGLDDVALGARFRPDGDGMDAGAAWLFLAGSDDRW